MSADNLEATRAHARMRGPDAARRGSFLSLPEPAVRNSLLALAFLAFATACGSQDEPAAADGDAAPTALATLPATLEGELTISVSEGDVDEGSEWSDINFGDLTVDGEEIAIEVTGDVLAASGIPADFETARVRATIRGKSQFDNYEITKLEKL